MAHAPSKWQAVMVLSAVIACSSKASDPADDGGNGGQAAASGSETGEPTSGTGSAGTSSAAGAPAIAQGGVTGEQGNAGEPGEGDPLTVDLILERYRSWGAQNEPQNVSGYIFGLCRAPTLPERAFAESVHGQERFVQDWANPAAKEGIQASGKPTFRAGSVIVKEKYTFVDDDAELDLVGVAVMIKRESGFSHEHGDWDYAYYEPEFGIVQTAEQSAHCAACHAAAAETDHVYVLGLKL